MELKFNAQGLITCWSGHALTSPSAHVDVVTYRHAIYGYESSTLMPYSIFTLRLNHPDHSTV